jgi:hypothetical protein
VTQQDTSPSREEVLRTLSHVQVRLRLHALAAPPASWISWTALISLIYPVVDNGEAMKEDVETKWCLDNMMFYWVSYRFLSKLAVEQKYDVGENV